MGVPGLWDVIRPAATQRSIVHLSIHDGFLSEKHNKRGYRIGIDASIWFFHAHSSREGENPELRMLFFRLAKFLALPLLPLFVFDGPNRPTYKRNKKVMGARHPLMGSFKTMIEAFGFEHHQAPGEAEAELAYLNRIETIGRRSLRRCGQFFVWCNPCDAKVSSAVMRLDKLTTSSSPSATLSGNKAHLIKNADGKQDDKHVHLFCAKRVREHPDIQLTHGGFILIGLMSGGDYDTGGLFKCGIKTAHGLARAGFGDSLVRIYADTPPHILPGALAEWRTSLSRYLATDPDKFIGRKNKVLANSIPATFPPIEVLEAYVTPVTSESRGIIPNFEWAKQPSLKDIANRCELHYEWGVKSLIIKRFRTVIWGGALMRVLRAAVMQGDEREAKKAQTLSRGALFTPKNGRRTAEMAVGTPSRFITQCLSRMELQSPRRLGGDDPFAPGYQANQEDEKLIVKIHSQRTHASTDGILEYRVEIAPAQFVRLTEEGLLNLRSEDSIDVENFGKRKNFDFEDEFGGGDEEGGEAGKRTKTVDPSEHIRIWVPACMLEMVEPDVVEEFENKATSKLQKQAEKEQRAKDKAEGKASPKKSRAKKTDTNATARTKPTEALISPPLDLPAELAELLKEPDSRPKYLSNDNSDDDLGPTPKAKTIKKTVQAIPRPMASTSKQGSSSNTKSLTASDTDYMSTDSITDLRLKRAEAVRRLPPISSGSINAGKKASSKPTSQKPSASAPASGTAESRRFLFTMQPDIVEDVSDEEEELDPYAILRTAAPTSKSQRPSKQRVRTLPDESVEDFSHLFNSDGSPKKGDATTISSPKRKNRFVTSDSSDEAPMGIRRSPKNSKKQAPAPQHPPRRDAETVKPASVAKKPIASTAATARATSSRSKPTPVAKKATEVIELSESSEEEEYTRSVILTAAPNISPAKSSPSKKARKPRKQAKADVSIIDLDDSS